MKLKTFNDPIWGAIDLDLKLVQFIDTPQFQRLHFIKQLGLACAVYPGASHSRFEHSIGTAHLAGELLKRVSEVKTKCLAIILNEKDIFCVKLAALLHDLGHGPFSHFWEFTLNSSADSSDCENRLSRTRFVHEEMTLKMIDCIIEENPYILSETGLNEDDILFVKELILPEKKANVQSSRRSQPLKNFYYEIVSNKLNGNDVDKWDYIIRDSHHVGINTSFEMQRLLKLCRVDVCEDRKTHIAWPKKEFDNVLLVYEQRKRLHKKVYQHRVIKPMEAMYVEVFKSANNFLMIPSVKDDKLLPLFRAHEDTYVFINLTDGIVSLIQNSLLPDSRYAKKLLRQIAKRCFGYFIGEALIAGGSLGSVETQFQKVQNEFKRFLTENHNEGCSQDTVDVIFESTKDVKVEMYKISLDFGMKEGNPNPMNHVYLYSKEFEVPVLASKLGGNYVEHNSPQKILESHIVVYAKCKSTQVQLIQNYFHSFCQQHKSTLTSHSFNLSTEFDKVLKFCRILEFPP